MASCWALASCSSLVTLTLRPGGQRTASTRWSLGLKLRSLGLIVSSVTHQVISVDPKAQLSVLPITDLIFLRRVHPHSSSAARQATITSPAVLALFCLSSILHTNPVSIVRVSWGLPVLQTQVMSLYHDPGHSSKALKHIHSSSVTTISVCVLVNGASSGPVTGPCP